MATAKSPFYIIREFLSPKICEQIINDLEFYTPDVDKEGNPIRMVRHHEDSQKIVYNRFEPLIDQFAQYFGYKHRGTELMSFEYYAEGVQTEPQCENSSWIRKKWTRTKDRDVSFVIFLNTYQDKIPFDTDYEVYGGKLEFPQHQFGFNPERGTLIAFPSGPHFINVVSPIIAGDLHLVRFHAAATMPYLYDPTKFPGDYRTWFKGLF